MSTGKRSKDDGKTKMYKVVKEDTKRKKTKTKPKTKEDYVKESEVNKKNKKGKKKGKHPKLKKALIIIFIIFILLCLIGVGIFAGVFFSDKLKLTKAELTIGHNNSVVKDIDDEQIFDLSSGDINRKIITYSEMGPYLPNAYVAIEDKRFYDHSGIDLTRTMSAAIQYVLRGGHSSYGGSTITQQLVKNLKSDKDDTGFAGVTRKIREMSRAYQIEQMLSKQQILEQYLNIIYVGGTTICGVENGAKYYFSKSAKDLDLAEAAFLAGINHSPNSYNPFWNEGDEDVTKAIKTRTKTVLAEMKDQNRISDNAEEAEKLYNEAVAEVEAGLKFKEGSFNNATQMSYHTDAAIKEVVSDLAELKDIDEKAARSLLVSGGYKIYTTQNTEIQKRMEKEYVKDEYVYYARTTGGPKENKEHTQSGMVIIDNKTGYVIGCMGGLGTDVDATGYNRAIQAPRQTGSAIKPLANVIPGLEEGVITAATVYDDRRADFGGGYAPKNVANYRGLTTVRKAIEVSSNVVNMKILSNVGPSKAIKYLQDMGLSHVNPDLDNNLALSIGGMSEGATPLEMAAAYEAIANGGEYTEPTFYTKVEDSNGNVILESKQEKRRVMEETTAYITADILKDVVTGSSGTAYMCKISGMDVAAKTGTTDSKKDKWLCGFTPYYSAATWVGYDTPEEVRYGNANAAQQIWARIMKDIHSDLKDAKFVKPSGITTATVCLQSGKLATKSCTQKYTEIFKAGTVPKYCEGHDKVKICKETGKLATEYCPEVEEKGYAVTPDKEKNPAWKSLSGTTYTRPTEECNKHTATNMVKVKNVVGKTEAAARADLAGLTIKVKYKESTKTPGLVISQSIKENEVVTKNTTITLTISKKKETTPETPPSGGNTEPPSGGGETNTENPPSGGGNTEKPSGGTGTNTVVNNA
ncbi:MAG: transglycosylase domain-containing protein [Clostridia bacterium]|nr:transglycosylase domain-containing protein [Clostridia bacterium]